MFDTILTRMREIPASSGQKFALIQCNSMEIHQPYNGRPIELDLHNIELNDTHTHTHTDRQSDRAWS